MTQRSHFFAQNIDVYYPNKVILSSFRFTFQSGVYPIWGENGCGKSTLLRTLAGCQAPNSGNVFLYHQPLYARMAPRALHFASAKPFLLPYLTLRENFQWIAASRSRPLNAVPAIIDQFDLSAYQDRLISKLSDGQRQRAHIAQAFMASPRVVLLDEPLAHLDPNTRQTLYSFFKGYGQSGRTILFTTHHQHECQHHFQTVWELTPSSLEPIQRELHESLTMAS